MIKTEAIVLKSADAGEVDRLLTIYSKELGKVRILAKGVKKIESKLRYSIEPFSYVQLILIEGRSFYILKDAVLIDQFLGVKRDLKKLVVAQKIREIIDQAIVGQEKDEDVWDLILRTFKKINQELIELSIVKEFFKNLIVFLGYDPQEVKQLRDLY